MASWIEVSLTADGEAAEAFAHDIYERCHQGVVIEPADLEPGVWDEGDVPPPARMTVRGYFADDDHAQATQEYMLKLLAYIDMLHPQSKAQLAFRYVHDEDWADAWKAHYRPIRLGKRILVRPRWVEITSQPSDIVISLDPGMAFGTGTHPSTQLCLEALEELVQPGMDVLDLGCGSGILAIGAALLGARRVLALDIDPLAVEATVENAHENGVADRIIAQEGSLETVLTSARRFDLVVVNILAKVIASLCRSGLAQTVRPGGRAIFSGVLESQADELGIVFRETGLQVVGQRQMGDWVLIEAVRSSES